MNSSGTPKIEINGLGTTGLLRILEVSHKRRTRMNPTLDKSRTCVWSAGDKEDLSHVGPVLKYFLSLTVALDRCVLCRT